MGAVSLPLIFWDVYNERVIESVGMGWDTGAPIWPYQTSDILLRLLNGPAYYLTVPVTNFFRLAAARHYILVFPAILIWWWLFGLRLDRGFVRTKSRWRWPIFAALVVLAAILLLAATVVSRDAFHWWFEYGRNFNREGTLLMLRFLGPAVWCVALTGLLVLAAKRLATQ
jgi:hypothetical protein